MKPVETYEDAVASLHAIAQSLADRALAAEREAHALRATLAGSDTPPTDTEIRLVLDAGGFWMHFSTEVGTPLLERSALAANALADDQRQTGRPVRWWAFAADGTLWVRR